MHDICTVILDVLLGLGFPELIFTAHRSGGVSEGSDAEGGDCPKGSTIPELSDQFIPSFFNDQNEKNHWYKKNALVDDWGYLNIFDILGAYPFSDHRCRVVPHQPRQEGKGVEAKVPDLG
jgi:hypothetical protein